MFYRWSRILNTPSGVPSPWVRSGEGCFTEPPASGIATGPSIEDLVLAEWRRLPLPKGELIAQPGGRTLVNFDTIFYTSVAEQDYPVTLLGQSVTIRATPATFLWHFGDGATLGPTDQAGAPYPAKDITHRYESAGATVDPRVDVTYRGQFSVAGGPFVDIAEPVTVLGDPVPLAIVEARSQLVDQPIG